MNLSRSQHLDYPRGLLSEAVMKMRRVLEGVERVGNALPHPAILFLLLTGVVLVASAVVTALGVEALHPVDKTPIRPVNLLSDAGLRLVIGDMVKNFTGFAPLGTVLVAMLGFSLAEKSGLLATLLRHVVLVAPRRLLVPAVLFAGVLSHTAGDIGYVLIIPLAAMAFHGVGLNPLAGLAICFAGVSGGFAANLLLSTADPMLAGISQEAARILDPSYVVAPVANWYFMATSSVLIVAVGTLVANRVTLPYLGPYRGDVPAPDLEHISPAEKRGLLYAGVVAALLVALLVLGLAPADGFLRDPAKPDVLHSPAIRGVVAIIFVFGALTGLAFGVGAGTMRTQQAVTEAMTDAMRTMAPYLVLVFFAAQFIALFNASNVGLILAVEGSDALKATGLGTVPLMIGFILLTCLLDLFIGSASAKWALMAPVFVPMLMLLQVAPELTQAAYRVGDSVVNIVSPLMSYFPLILAFASKYQPEARLGTVIALMLPYSAAFLLFWSMMLLVWLGLDLPLGPGSQLRYVVP